MYAHSGSWFAASRPRATASVASASEKSWLSSSRMLKAQGLCFKGYARQVVTHDPKCNDVVIKRLSVQICIVCSILRVKLFLHHLL